MGSWGLRPPCHSTRVMLVLALRSRAEILYDLDLEVNQVVVCTKKYSIASVRVTPYSTPYPFTRIPSPSLGWPHAGSQSPCLVSRKSDNPHAFPQTVACNGSPRAAWATGL